MKKYLLVLAAAVGLVAYAQTPQYPMNDKAAFDVTDYSSFLVLDSKFDISENLKSIEKSSTFSLDDKVKSNFTGDQDIYFWVSSNTELIGKSFEEKAAEIKNLDPITDVEKSTYVLKEDTSSEFIFIGSETYFDKDIGGTPLPGSIISAIMFSLSVMGLSRRNKD